MDPDLYPDLIAAAGLSAALEQAAAGLGADLVIVRDGGDAVLQARVATAVPDRDPLVVHTYAKERGFTFSGWSRGVELISGSTADLGDVVRVGAAWGDGTGFRDLHQRFSFLHPSERAEAHERGPAAEVELQWRRLHEQAAEAPDFDGFRLLVQAAHAEPRLRQLFAFSSHWVLGFSARTGHPSRLEVAIVPAHDGHPYRVKDHLHLGDGVIGEVATAEEAVALAVAHLPAGLGPAVAGTSAPDDGR
ncbi:DUF6193 family natural product biosynthesis protein [Streptomyces sp. PA03-5A]|nr:DUF6193 family natural product biosynthesis protein [Streptomyces sp. PA03-5A]